MDQNFKPSFNPAPGMIGFIVAAVILGIILIKSVVVIPAGYVGIMDLFGKVSEKALPAGMHFINPLKKVTRMSIQTREIKETAEVPSKEGLIVSLDLSLLFSLDPAAAPDVYRRIGINYIRVVVEPQLRSVVRGVTSGFEAKALYTAERENISSTMHEQLRPILEERGIIVERILLRSVTLPPILASAIEKKLEEEQRAEQMKFILDRERAEAQRKQIEAKGIADFQAIVARGISANLLKWKGIEATQKLAESQNTKVIIVGNSKDGLPVILGGMDK
ncbi:MAG: prohibitin family protein [Elusimicrobia bacterium]|nr:prohibitin family protein [Elusimicrobiota bacterium]MBD3412425.1 prohibitin family protein [Elusimicrobiota bacterium]